MTCTLCYEYVKTNQSESILDETENCFYVEFDHPVLESWGMILPKRCVETVFDLSEQEFLESKHLLENAKNRLSKTIKPDGYSIGWNCYKVGGQTTPHANMHIMPRFKDEPFAGKGIRHWFKKEENLRLSLRK